MQGVTIQANSTSSAYLVTVDVLSDELKNAIRLDLSKVCHGSQKGESGSIIYSYKFTVKEFVKRYKTKNILIKMGMIGELLTHVLLSRFKKNFKVVSPFFNSEESSIKKGFDLLLFEEGSQSVWFTEVKSGELGKNTPKEKVLSLIDLAKRDLLQRINANDSTTWYSAINSVELALASGKSEKNVLISLLSEFISGPTISEDLAAQQSAVLAPIVFENVRNPVGSVDVFDKYDKVKTEAKFKDCVVFAIQKSTFLKIEQYLMEEAGA